MLHFLSITDHTLAFRARTEENIAEKYNSNKKNIISKQSANNIKIIQVYKSQNKLKVAKIKEKPYQRSR